MHVYGTKVFCTLKWYTSLSIASLGSKRKLSTGNLWSKMLVTWDCIKTPQNNPVAQQAVPTICLWRYHPWGTLSVTPVDHKEQRFFSISYFIMTEFNYSYKKKGSKVPSACQLLSVTSLSPRQKKGCNIIHSHEEKRIWSQHPEPCTSCMHKLWFNWQKWKI